MSRSPRPDSAACHAFREWFISETPGKSTSDTASRISLHVAECDKCEAWMLRYGAAVNGLGRHYRSEGPPGSRASFLGALHARRQTGAAPRRSTPWWQWAGATLATSSAAALTTIAVMMFVVPGGRSPSEARSASAPAQSASPSGSNLALTDSLAMAPGGGEPSRVVTSPDTTTTLEAPGGATASLGPSTAVQRVVWTPLHTELRLEYGTVECTVPPLSDGHTFEVVTPYSRVHVVGTEFSVHHTPAAFSEVRVGHGRVRVVDADGALLGIVADGQRLVVRPPRAEHTEILVDETWDVHRRGVADATRRGHLDMEASEEPVPVAAQRPPERSFAGPPARPQAIGRRAKPPRATHRRAKARRSVRVSASSGATPSRGASSERARAESSQESESAAPSDSSAETLANRLDRAREELAAGRDEAALAVLAPGSHPKLESSVAAWRLRGDAQRLLGRTRDAVGSYERAIVLAGVPSPRADRLLEQVAQTVQAGPSESDALAAWARVAAQAGSSHSRARAHLWLANRATAQGDSAEARAQWQALLDTGANVRAVSTALGALGRFHLDARQWAAAERLFSPYVGHTRSGVAETALVGMMWVRRGQGRQGAVRALLDKYEVRYPQGRRRNEVERLRASLAGDEPG